MKSRHALVLPLHGRLVLLFLAAALLAWGVHALLVLWPLPQVLDAARQGWGWELQAPEPWSAVALAWSLALLLPLYIWLASTISAPLQRTLRALQGAVLSYGDGDYSMSISAAGQSGELGELLRLHAELGQALRQQRQQLATRELLLDTVVQHTPMALLLIDDRGQVAYGNLAARQLLARGRSLASSTLDALLAEAPAALREALASGQDQLFAMEEAGIEERFHLSQRALSLQGQPYRLLLLRRMTRELSRQEVASWKRVIRVISHELNNSLAPISSLAHSGAELARRGQPERLPQVFQSIGERARHLHQFLAGYAQFAKLPQPQISEQRWAAFARGLADHCSFQLLTPLADETARFDAAQLEQALINLIKNAHEAGGPPEQVSLAVSRRAGEWWISVADRGPGMSEAVLAQALLPFYSTKRSGTGLGLALAREIAEAHGGRILLANREGGGLEVSLLLPG
ncbi:HAMP domain-containing sensor histidine kinase [Paucibacter sp. APW11]|uniref:histidine kinase n=1 Tax=Roseateles aquae TaxID=3077235 RepID=A0ABU3PGZ6_9BURK|nr:HAMP domain-containing sensor histidine kinase [Paucibacter sp. APW11]MDT9001810.1 HAMP domain-containing sensor histidine kinase [Paucibacter sp. APW11]